MLCVRMNSIGATLTIVGLKLVGPMVTESVRYGVSHPMDRWVAMGAIVCLLGHLIAAPTSAA